MDLWSTQRKHNNARGEKFAINMGVTSTPRLNMNHGFIKSIVRNQIDRDEYDKLVSKGNGASSYFHRVKSRKTCDPQLLYIPPHLRTVDKETSNSKKSSETVDEKARIRKEIRRRLMEEMAKKEHERLQVTAEVVISTLSTKTKNSADLRRFSDAPSGAKTPRENEPLFKLKVRGRDGSLIEQIIHSNDNGARVAKNLARQFEFSDDQCRLLRNQIEQELEKRLQP